MKVFVSYNFNDRENCHSIKAMTREKGGPVDASFIFVKNDVSRYGSAAIDKEINSTMQGCSSALFIIGNNNHNSPWINREVELAISKNLDIYITRLPRTQGGLPQKLPRNRYTEVTWGANNLDKALVSKKTYI